MSYYEGDLDVILSNMKKENEPVDEKVTEINEDKEKVSETVQNEEKFTEINVFSDGVNKEGLMEAVRVWCCFGGVGGGCDTEVGI